MPPISPLSRHSSRNWLRLPEGHHDTRLGPLPTAQLRLTGSPRRMARLPGLASADHHRYGHASPVKAPWWHNDTLLLSLTNLSGEGLHDTNARVQQCRFRSYTPLGAA